MKPFTEEETKEIHEELGVLMDKHKFTLEVRQNIIIVPKQEVKTEKKDVPSDK